MPAGPLDPAAIQARSLEAWIRLLGSSSPGARVLEPRPGVRAALAPAAPERGIAHSVLAADGRELIRALPELERELATAGSQAFDVWVPEWERETAEALLARGLTLDGRPAAMIAGLAGWEPGTARAPDGYELLRDGDPVELGRINDLAYGHSGGGRMGPALENPPPELGLHVHEARAEAGEVVATLGVIDTEAAAGGSRDAVIVFVATDPAHQGRALATNLMRSALDDARERGCETSSLQASSAGAPVYERLGYARVFGFELFERRIDSQVSAAQQRV